MTRTPPIPMPGLPGPKGPGARPEIEQLIQQAQMQEFAREVQNRQAQSMILTVGAPEHHAFQVVLTKDTRLQSVGHFWTLSIGLHASGLILFQNGVWVAQRFTIKGIEQPLECRLDWKLFALSQQELESIQVVEAKPWMALNQSMLEEFGAWATKNPGALENYDEAVEAFFKEKETQSTSASADKVAEGGD